mgnify:CR=1 FL=1
MSGKIKAIAEQAKKSVPHGILTPDKWIDEYNVKFTELIIKECFDFLDDETEQKIKSILKKLKLSNFYEHDTYILSRIIGKTAPVMTREVEEKLRYMFREIQGSFSKHCPSTRNNFLSYHLIQIFYL